MHKGSTALACELARQAKSAGADIFKMQFGWPADDKLRHVGYAMAQDVARYCKHIGIELMASIWSEEGLIFARAVEMKRYKIAHQKANDSALIHMVNADGKEVFMSVTMEPQGDTVQTFPRHAGNARMIYTTDSYPTYPWNLNLPEFGLGHNTLAVNTWYGYSDHTLGTSACLLAVARGAQYIEKHFTLDKTDLSVRDTPLSASPAEFAEMVRVGRGLEGVRDAAL